MRLQKIKGRAAQTNPKNRFEKIYIDEYETHDDYYSSDIDAEQ